MSTIVDDLKRETAGLRDELERMRRMRASSFAAQGAAERMERVTTRRLAESRLLPSAGKRATAVGSGGKRRQRVRSIW